MFPAHAKDPEILLPGTAIQGKKLDLITGESVPFEVVLFEKLFLLDRSYIDTCNLASRTLIRYDEERKKREQEEAESFWDSDLGFTVKLGTVGAVVVGAFLGGVVVGGALK